MEVEIDIDIGNGITVDIIDIGDDRFRYDIYDNHVIVGAFSADDVNTNITFLNNIYRGMKEDGQLF